MGSSPGRSSHHALRTAIAALLVLLLVACCIVLADAILSCWLAGGYLTDFAGTCRGVGLVWGR